MAAVPRPAVAGAVARHPAEVAAEAGAGDVGSTTVTDPDITGPWITQSKV